MSKINAIRIVNLNYNNNSIKIEDETFHLGGEGTLFSLRNGGGKSVLVQILTAPFVHKRYRDTKDRAFASYFTTNKPAIILVEWGLDGGAGYVLTGMLVRRNKEENGEEDKEELEVIQFIHEYQEPNAYDINSFPFLEEVQGISASSGKKQKSFYAIKQCMEELKKEKKFHFDYYDMNVASQSRVYFDKLKEYRIYYKEWETIIKKVNLKESGLSELFTDAKDESGLIDKWFLDAVENKLNREESKIKDFGQILLKYIRQYKENKLKIERKSGIQLFIHKSQEIFDKAAAYQGVLKERADLEEKIGRLLGGLRFLSKAALQEKEGLEESLLTLEDSIKEIQHEEISYEIYELQDKRDLKEREYQEADRSVQEQAEDKNRITRQIHSMECAKILGDYTELASELKGLEYELELAKSKNLDLEPERNQLGYNLKVFYEKEEEKTRQLLSELNRQIEEDQTKIREWKQDIDQKQQEQTSISTSLGSLKANIDTYHETERIFNNRFKENLTRNILGDYEEDTIESLEKKTQELISKKTQEVTRLKQDKEETEEKLYTCTRNMEDLLKELGGMDAFLDGLKKELEGYENQIAVRKEIIRYIHLKEDRLFDLTLILEGFDKKLEELKETARYYDREMENLKAEYKKLESGQVLKLPRELEELLDTEEIPYVFGMEWLKKNNKTLTENKGLLKKNPFIPYSLIMSEKDLERLNQKKDAIYTNYPVPIITRNKLEEPGEEVDNAVITGEKVNFYILFNQELLDEDALAVLLNNKEKEIKAKLEFIKAKEEEIQFYQEKRDYVKYQTLSEKEYKACRHKIKAGEEKKTDLGNQVSELRTKKEMLEGELKNTGEILNRFILEGRELAEKQEELHKLREKYEAYLEQRKKYNQLTLFLQSLAEEIKEYKRKLEKSEEEIRQLTGTRFQVKNSLEQIGKKQLLYSAYQEGVLLHQDIREMEARYEAITKEMTLEQQALEEQSEKTRKKFTSVKEELEYKAGHYHLAEEDYSSIRYDRNRVEELEKSLQLKDGEIENLKNKRSDMKSFLAVLENQITEKRKQLENLLKKKDLVPRQVILATDFKWRVLKKKEEMEACMKKFNLVKDKLAIYQDNLSNLAEYDNLQAEEDKEFIQTLTMNDREGLNKFRGNLLRDYRLTEHDGNEARQTLYEALHEIMKQVEFSEDFFLKPLETLYQLREEPSAILEQLSMTIASYENLMAKLEIDISMVDAEKDKVLDIFLDYVKEVHKNLGKIDKNSTIRIRERSVKMLRIKLTDWEENESLYRTRLKEFLEEITKSGLFFLEKNENVEEYIGSQVTTRNLYDTVVGIHSIDIKLYKIEEQREYPISWAEVAKNSGGEGFLSAFVILSSLLSFMRREDTDIFSEYEEGKVLIMDNPFAQTNAAHLLKPLMDIAKKSNTQLICLSGLGGESIYNRFDNIYVLNLMTSEIRQGMQYLRGEHTKGEEQVQSLVSSHIKVEDAEQIELLF